MEAIAIINEDLAKFDNRTITKLSFFSILLLFNYL
jgi:hypothetical protein